MARNSKGPKGGGLPPLPGTSAPDWVGWLGVCVPVVQRACGHLVEAIVEIGEDKFDSTTAVMRIDPMECIIWERAEGVRAWDLYEAGGELDAERAELAFGSESVSFDYERLIAVLKAFKSARARFFRLGPMPWQIFIEAPGAPFAVVDLYPGIEPEDFIARLVLGGSPDMPGFVPAEPIEKAWISMSQRALQKWLSANSKRAPSDHPSFQHVMAKPTSVSAGVYAVRVQPRPFSPFVHSRSYSEFVEFTVCETMEELDECAKFYQTPGAFYSNEPPFYRSRTPCADRAARFAGNFVGSVTMVEVPWAGRRVISVISPPSEWLVKLSKASREKLHRMRYIAGVSDDLESARREVSNIFGSKTQLRYNSEGSCR